MTHVLCAHLPYWPIDRLRRKSPELRGKPLVLVETSGNRQTVVHVSREVPADLYPGMPLAEAKARCAELIDLPAIPAADARALMALGHWLMRFSPSVSVYDSATIFLDASGLERLFGGVDNLRARVVRALASLRLTAGVTIAPTPGAAWALAVYGASAPRIITQDQLPGILSSLPPAALRLNSQTVVLLGALGIQTIGMLLKLPRSELAIRFGSELLLQIDQATGAVHEPLTYLIHRSPIRATLEFESAIESLETIHLVLQELIHQVAGQLTVRGLGARRLQLIWRQPYAPAIEKTVQLMRPCRNELALFKLLSCTTEQLHAREGFVAATLTVDRSERLDAEQAALMENDDAYDAVELDRLVERLRARLGGGVEWGELVESNLPECRSQFQDTACGSKAAPAHPAVDLLRPLRLLRQPRAIKVIVRPSESHDGRPVAFTDGGQRHLLDHIRSPERITGQWWRGRSKIRDYFDVLDGEGRRYWIFRVAQTGRWFLHGVFE